MSNDSPVDLNVLQQELTLLKSRVSALEKRASNWEIPLDQVDSLFERLFLDLSDQGIARLLRELQTGDLPMALIGIDLRVLGRIRGNISANAWRMLVEEIKYHANPWPYPIWARQRVLEAAKQLLTMGEISSSEKFYEALTGRLADPLPAYVPPTEEELAARQREETERKEKREHWLISLDDVKAIKENQLARE